MARSRKPHAAAPAPATDAMADIVRRGATDSFVIAVAAGSSVAVRTVPKPPRLRRGAVARGAYAGYVARRLAEIEAAVGELLAATTGGAEGTESDGLTAHEARVLASGGLDTSPLRAGEEEPLIETALEYARLLQSSLSVEQAAQLLAVNPSRIRQRLSGHPRTLYGLKEGRSWRVPRFQFSGRKPIPGVAAVIGALPPDLHPVAVRRWFTAPHPDLPIGPDEARPVTPLEWLRTGRAPEVVADLARNI